VYFELILQPIKLVAMAKKKKPATYWNFRMLAHRDGDGVYLRIHEVYYKRGKPTSYALDPSTVNGLNKKEIRWSLKQMKRAMKQPVLWHGDRFPKKYKRKKT
jgi:hypothetical protein